MEHSESPPKNSESPKSSSAQASILLGAALVLAGLSAWQAQQDAPTPFILLGIGALYSFAGAQFAAGRPLVAGLAASITGAGLGAFLTSSIDKAESMCAASSWSDCGTVLTSDWSEIAGFSTSGLAMAFYAGLTAVLLRSILKKDHQPAAPLLLLSGVFASGFSAFLAYQSKVGLGEWCLFCIALYSIAGLTLIAGILATRAHPEHTLSTALTYDKGGLTGTGLIVGILVLWATPKDSSHAGHSHEADLYTVVDGDIALTGREPAKGSVKAPWTVLEFTDYSCGHCADQAPVIQQVVKRHPKIKLLHKHYAFISDSSVLAAKAANCAHRQGRFWDMNSAIFDNLKKDWTADDLSFLANARVGLDRANFEACLEDPSIQSDIDNDYETAQKAGVSGTPSFFVNFGGQVWIKINGAADTLEYILSLAEQGESFPGLSAESTAAPEASPPSGSESPAGTESNDDGEPE